MASVAAPGVSTPQKEPYGIEAYLETDRSYVEFMRPLAAATNKILIENIWTEAPPSSNPRNEELPDRNPYLTATIERLRKRLYQS